jgi:acyl carrier protein
MISAELKAVILEQLKLDDYDLQDDTIAAQVPGWDSLNHLNIIIAVEKKFGIKFKGRGSLPVNCVGDLQKIIDSKSGK